MKKLLFLAAAVCTVAVTAGGFRFTGGTGFELDTVNNEKLSGKFFVIERNKGELKLNSRNEGNKKILSNKDFELTLTAKETFPLTTITVTAKNLSNKQLLLEPGMQLAVKVRKGDQFWAGFDIFDAENKVLGRKGYKGRYSKHISGGVTQPFPTASLIGNGRAIILGGRLFEISSYADIIYNSSKTNHQ